MLLLTIDVGGTSIKFALYQDGKLSHQKQRPTPKDLEHFYLLLEEEVKSYQAQHNISGLAFSLPGAVNKEKGIIEGASALPYIHHFKIAAALEERLGLAVSMENDANCAALAESALGSGKNAQSMATLVLGTGVGGSLVIDGKIHHGAHLFGGEFGFMVMNEDYQIFSHLGTVVAMAKRYCQKKADGKTYSGKEILALAENGDPLAIAERQVFLKSLAMGIYNIQHSFDPQLIAIGGAVSQADFLLPYLEKELDKIYEAVQISTNRPNLAICHFKQEANLLGAAIDFIHSRKED
ncbi:ROK family protein [Streptococcus catagoni]|uniref:ROK family protein n=1 Tax=Streptococcus catagoni TaxID=2654874 RepID=UPI00140E85D1|nr:ROK family protein [Streptococcus catagoni]